MIKYWWFYYFRSVDTKPFLWNNYPEHKYSSGLTGAGAGAPGSGLCSPTSLADPVCSPVTPHQVRLRHMEHVTLSHCHMENVTLSHEYSDAALLQNIMIDFVRDLAAAIKFEICIWSMYNWFYRSQEHCKLKCPWRIIVTLLTPAECSHVSLFQAASWNAYAGHTAHPYR